MLSSRNGLKCARRAEKIVFPLLAGLGCGPMFQVRVFREFASQSSRSSTDEPHRYARLNACEGHGDRNWRTDFHEVSLSLEFARSSDLAKNAFIHLGPVCGPDHLDERTYVRLQNSELLLTSSPDPAQEARWRRRDRF